MRWLCAFLKIGLVSLIACVSFSTQAAEDINKLMAVVGAKIEGKVITLQQLHVPIVTKDGLRGQAEVTLAFELKTSQALKRASQVLPRIRDAIFQHMHTFFGTAWVPHTKVDVPLIQEQLYQISKKYIGDDLKACRVLDLKVQDS